MAGLAEALGHFRLGCYRLRLVARDRLLLPPYKGSTLRGAFGHAFKRAVCSARGKRCATCLLAPDCPYAYVFLTPTPEDAAMMRKYPHAPHPFVIEPPLEERRSYDAGDCLSFGLVLVGRALQHLPYFIYAFGEMGQAGLGKRRGKCSLECADALCPSGALQRAYNVRDSRLRPDLPRLTLTDLADRRRLGNPVRIHFISPTRIKHGGRFVSNLPFDVLVRNLLRRLSALSYFHCGKELKLDFRRIIEKARGVATTSSRLTWHDWERYSSQQTRRMKLGGFVGQVTYDGPVADFAPLLLLGERVHVGKAATFGLGQFRIEA